MMNTNRWKELALAKDKQIGQLTKDRTSLVGLLMIADKLIGRNFGPHGEVRKQWAAMKKEMAPEDVQETLGDDVSG